MSTYYEATWEHILTSSCALIIIPSIIHVVLGGIFITRYDSSDANTDANTYNIIMLFISGIIHFGISCVTLCYISYYKDIQYNAQALREKCAIAFTWLFFVVPFASVLYGTSIFRAVSGSCYEQYKLFMIVYIAKLVILIIAGGILIPEMFYRCKQDIHTPVVHINIHSPNNVVIGNAYISNDQVIQIRPGNDDVKINQPENDIQEKDTDNKNISTCSICYESKWMMVFMPCGHAKCCINCTRRLSNNEHFKCPLCRCVVEKYAKLHL